jgi:hypothetical protein
MDSVTPKIRLIKLMIVGTAFALGNPYLLGAGQKHCYKCKITDI